MFSMRVVYVRRPYIFFCKKYEIQTSLYFLETLHFSAKFSMGNIFVNLDRYLIQYLTMSH